MNFYIKFAVCFLVVCVGVLVSWRNSRRMRPGQLAEAVSMLVIVAGLVGMFLAALV
jgi:hypothetical protein